MTDHLLGDRGGADRPLTAAVTRDIGHRGAKNGLRVHPFMRVEIAVLGGEEGVDDKRRHLADRHRDAPLGFEFGDEFAVRVIDLAADRGHVVRDPLEIRQIMAEIIETVSDSDRPARNTNHHEHESDARYTTQKRQQHHSLAVLAETHGPAPWVTREPCTAASREIPASRRKPLLSSCDKKQSRTRMVPDLC